MFKILSVSQFLTVACLLLLGGAANAAGANVCDAPEDLTSDTAPLPHVAEVLKPGSTLDVLTVGSATVFSPDQSLQAGTLTGQALGLGNGPKPGVLPMPSDAAFPLRMAHVLEDMFPGLKVNVTVRGGRGITAHDMLDIIQAEVPSHNYRLVIWQTGTVESVRNVPAGDFYQTLSDGAELITSAGADLVLVDPQFSRFLHANADLTPYLQTMQEIAAQPGIVLFHRFALMQGWASDGQIDLERTPKAQRLKTVETLHACLGAILAHFVTASAQMQP